MKGILYQLLGLALTAITGIRIEGGDIAVGVRPRKGRQCRRPASVITSSTSARRGRPERATILAPVRAGTPVAVERQSGAGGIERRTSRTRRSASGGVSLASLRGRLPRSDMGSPRLARTSHLEAAHPFVNRVVGT